MWNLGKYNAAGLLYEEVKLAHEKVNEYIDTDKAGLDVAEWVGNRAYDIKQFATGMLRSAMANNQGLNTIANQPAKTSIPLGSPPSVGKGRHGKHSKKASWPAVEGKYSGFLFTQKK